MGSGRGARRRLGTAVAGVLSLLVLLALVLATRPGARYVLVIDAGSSGTRMYAYTWRDGAGAGGAPALAAVPSTAAPHKVPRRALPGKRAYQRVETEPGLDRFLGDEAGLEERALGAAGAEGGGGWGGRGGASAVGMAACPRALRRGTCQRRHSPPVGFPISSPPSITCLPACLRSCLCAGPLLEWAAAVVPRRQWARTPVFLFGTAGLRKLRWVGRGVAKAAVTWRHLARPCRAAKLHLANSPPRSCVGLAT